MKYIFQKLIIFFEICELGNNDLEYKLMNLIQDNEYKIRIYAFNDIGSNYLIINKIRT